MVKLCSKRPKFTFANIGAKVFVWVCAMYGFICTHGDSRSFLLPGQCDRI